MYSFPNLEPVHCSISCSNCCFLTYIQISREAGKVVWYLHNFKSFPQFVWHTESKILTGSAILIPACVSSSPAFLMMYSAYKLNKQGDNIQPWRTPFLIWNQSVVPCPVLTVASWPAYRFHKRQVRWSGIPISFRIFHSLLWNSHSPRLWHSQQNT